MFILLENTNGYRQYTGNESKWMKYLEKRDCMNVLSNLHSFVLTYIYLLLL